MPDRDTAPGRTPIATRRTAPLAELDARNGRLRIFISYSRDDLEFAEQLDAALDLYGFECTLDRHSISGGEDWQRRLGALIAEADTIAFVLSPASARSEICAWEVAEAVRLGKRILPVCTRPVADAAPPPSLAALNYVFFYPEPRVPGSGFGTGLANLVAALETDIDWQRQHTRYLQRALEWEAGGRQANRLLSGLDIGEAKSWAAVRPKDAAAITDLQLEFMRASEDEERRRGDAERQRVEAMAAANTAREQALAQAEKALTEAADQQRRRTRLRNLALVVVSGLAVLALVLGKRAEDQRLAAEAQRLTAEQQRKLADESRAIAESRLKTAEEVVAAATKIIVKHAEEFEADDQHTANIIFRHGADLGNAQAMNNLGVQYGRGRGGLTQDYAKALEWYEKAASKGMAKPMENIAWLYANGNGVQRDLAKARDWFEKAADLGLPSAMARVGILYIDGVGVPRDLDKGREWLMRAAQKNHPTSVMDVGRLHERGLGVPKDIAEAIRWYEKAVDLGERRAMTRLGTLYAEGVEVKQDYVMARRWFERAHEAGWPEGSLWLARLYEEGLGIAADAERAKELYLRAAARGEERATLRLTQMVAKPAISAGRYADAYAQLVSLGAEIEPLERKLTGSAGPQTAYIQSRAAWAAVLANDPAKALPAAERAVALTPGRLIAVLHLAHALMLQNRTEEARARYLSGRGQIVHAAGGLSWEKVVASDFADMRKIGIDTPLMKDVETALALPAQ